MENPKLSVSEFITFFNQTMEYTYPIVMIEGEVMGYTLSQGKYIYFDLKDEGGSVRCFSMAFNLRMPIENGMKVVITAQPKLTNKGFFSLTVRTVIPVGEGALKKSFELLKLKLENDGLFSEERKRPLPQIPKYVGVISSTQAAGYADFVKIINERWGGLKVDVAHVQVQGEVAPDQMIRAIEYFNLLETPPEVLVIIRGGGSADDLAAFNDEQLVRAIAASRVPTLVGVGHEVDVTLSDLVADKRAATPSNAAQILVPDKREIIAAVEGRVQRIIPRMLQVVDEKSDDVRALIERAFSQIEQGWQQLDDKRYRLQQVLEQLNPNLALKRGYALLRGERKIGATIEIETVDAIMGARIEKYERK